MCILTCSGKNGNNFCGLIHGTSSHIRGFIPRTRFNATFYNWLIIFLACSHIFNIHRLPPLRIYYHFPLTGKQKTTWWGGLCSYKSPRVDKILYYTKIKAKCKEFLHWRFDWADRPWIGQGKIMSCHSSPCDYTVFPGLSATVVLQLSPLQSLPLGIPIKIAIIEK